VNLTSYAELAVRLVNTAFRANSDPDPLGTTHAFSMLFSDQPHLSGPVTPVDLDALRLLRGELSAVFTEAVTGRDREAIARLNALLIRTPIQPEIVSHDDQRWHVHLVKAGSVADRYAASAVIGLTLTVSQFGLGRLGACSIAACQRVFIDGSPNRSRRYCAEHSASRGNVTTIRAAG
jgi:predicted RNA-binding Zn ribbon-like protein